MCSANHVCAAFDALRHVFRLNVGTSVCLDKLNLVLVDFDVAWTEFECKVCECYFCRAYKNRRAREEETCDYVVLMSESILGSIDEGLLRMEQLHEMDPCLMWALPRLCVVYGLELGVEREFRFYSDKRRMLESIRGVWSGMGQVEKRRLKECLLNGMFVENVSDELSKCFREICCLADELQSGSYAKEFNGVLSRVFTMYKE